MDRAPPRTARPCTTRWVADRRPLRPHAHDLLLAMKTRSWRLGRSICLWGSRGSSSYHCERHHEEPCDWRWSPDCATPGRPKRSSTVRRRTLRLAQAVGTGEDVQLEPSGNLKLAVDRCQMISQSVLAHHEFLRDRNLLRTRVVHHGRDDLALARSQAVDPFAGWIRASCVLATSVGEAIEDLAEQAVSSKSGLR